MFSFKFFIMQKPVKNDLEKSSNTKRDDTTSAFSQLQNSDILEFIDSDCSNFLSNLGLMIASCNELFPRVKTVKIYLLGHVKHSFRSIWTFKLVSINCWWIFWRVCNWGSWTSRKLPRPPNCTTVCWSHVPWTGCIGGSRRWTSWYLLLVVVGTSRRFSRKKAPIHMRRMRLCWKFAADKSNWRRRRLNGGLK